MDIYQEMIALYYGWHQFEKPFENIIVDFDLLGQSHQYDKSYRDRNEILDDLNRLITAYQAKPDKEEFIEDKLIAAKYYLRALIGDNIPYYEYIDKTMGVPPDLFTEERVREERDKTAEGYKKIGYSYDYEGMEKIEKETCYSGKSEIMNSFKTFEKYAVPKIVEWLDLDIKPVYSIDFTEKEVYWLNYICTDENGKIGLVFNVHDSVLNRWRKGATEFYVLHEICCHVLQFLSWQKRIENNQLNPFAGLTSVFTPEQFTGEGVAQTLNYFLPESILPDFSEVYMHQNNLYHIVMANAHVMINEDKPMDKILEYIQIYFPKIRKNVLTNDLQKRATDPLFRTYQYIYSKGMVGFQNIAAKLKNETEKKAFIKDIFHNAYPARTLLKKYGMDMKKSLT